DSIDWSKFAYVLYATSSSHMCNSMMIFAELRKFNTRAELVLLVKQEFLSDLDNHKHEYETLTKFSSDFNVVLKPTPVTQIGGDEVDIWKSSFTKLMVFNESDYDRIIYLDADAIVLQGNLDELFFLPPVKLAVPTAYWLTKIQYEKMAIDEFQLTNIVMVIQPSRELFARVLNAIENKRKNEYDMDLHFSYLADTHEQVFAHRLLETSNREPAYYETKHMEKPGEYFAENIKYLHFSDAPVPKPW
ncbi:glycosyltransferase family 8 protein, partial [Wickerhamomyces anomalus NRRL Y-366-8]